MPLLLSKLQEMCWVGHPLPFDAKGHGIRVSINAAI
jgi:hypothetical protein